MIQTTGLSYAYDAQAEFRFPDIHLADAENLVILGESGIGKTTLLHLLAGLLVAKTGKVLINNTDITQLGARELDHFRGNNMGFVFQKPYFVKSLSLIDNLLLLQYLAGRKSDQTKIKQVLDRLGIKDKERKKTYQLSQGEQQRASIAMAIINDPKIILADEPTSSLDDKNCLNVTTLLKSQASATGANLVVITHDQRLKTQFENQLQL
ncbi:ATP-binding cassette domain-containing protein [Fulvivirgaceae bacterium BMA12]|uniref:ATP-binding cassette domain-containing protein n=1 Tax=Agaribacillus aureus TaxID=3051825 RepID=A0ABT8LK29_9BACT|nr:ATP-binding cassette domain-containing protein [Fulvivirgaceae bacterium BMA12]